MIVAVGVLANLGVIESGLFSDDHFHMAAIGFRILGLPVPGYWWEIFGVPSSRSAELETLMRNGVLPWWTSSEYSTAFLRPLAVATHYFDYYFFFGSAARMHAHNLLWYGLLVALVGSCYRRFCSTPKVATLASLIYALDDAHSEGVAWIAGRNTLMSACAAAGVLLAHDEARRTGSRRFSLLAHGVFVLGLAAGEGGISAWAMLLAYEVTLAEGTVRLRARALVGYVAVTAAWLILYKVGGYGARGGAIYLDPLRHPFAFLEELPTRITVLWLELLTFPNALYDTISTRWVSSVRNTSFLLCLAFSTYFVRMAWKEKSARFWLLQSALALVPFCGVASGARLLFVPGIGTMALLALPVASLLDSAIRDGNTDASSRTRGVGFLSLACIAVHMAGAVAFIPVKMKTVERQNVALRTLATSLPVNQQRTKETTVFVLNTANYLLSLLTPFGREANEQLGGLYILGASQHAVVVTRVSEKVVRLDAPTGFFEEASATFVRHPNEPFGLGTKRRVGPAFVSVVGLDRSGLATTIEVELEDFDDPKFVWAYWDGSEAGYRRLAIPRLGDTVQLPVRKWAPRAETSVRL